jgi:hypothetical protein
MYPLLHARQVVHQLQIKHPLIDVHGFAGIATQSPSLSNMYPELHVLHTDALWHSAQLAKRQAVKMPTT